MKNPLRFSKFLGLVKKGKLVAVFHKLHPSPLYIENKEWVAFKRNPQKRKDLIMKLKRKGIIIDSASEDSKCLMHTREKLGDSFKRTSILYLILTQQCNLRCKYCFLASRFDKKKKIVMGIKTAKAGINLWIRHIHNNFDEHQKYFVIFYGGEPLLNSETLKESLIYIRNCQKEGKLPVKNLHKILSTNGILIDEETAKLLKKHKVTAVVGLDGKKTFHNYYRVDKKGNGTFSKVIKAINLLQKNKVDIGISVAITPYNLKGIKNISTFLKKYRIKNFGFNILKGKTLLFIDPKMDYKDYFNKAAEVIIKNFEISKKGGIYERQIQEKLKGFRESNFCPIDCGGYGGQIVVQPNGDINNCPLFQNKIENIKNIRKGFKIWQNPIIKKWQKRLPLYNAECLKCNAISICGGGCPWSVNEREGTIFEKDDSVCIINKKIFNFFLWKTRKNNLI